MLMRWIKYTVLLIVGVSVLGFLLLLFVMEVARQELPPLDRLTDYRPKIPLRVYSSDGVLIGEFGEERRSIVKIAQVPKHLVNAVLAAEDTRFYEHSGVDYYGFARAVVANVTSGQAHQGASTITMQVARNFFLSPEKSISRKFNEVLLAREIESRLSKEQILELYLNQIFLGQRAYGFAAAAQIYFGKPLAEITVAEAAMLAGLPKAPSKYNPVVNPKRAKIRQQWVLRRMQEFDMVSAEQYKQAAAETLNVRRVMQDYTVHAEHVAEMVRLYMVEKYKDAAYTAGYRVVTTLDSKHQTAAVEAVRKGAFEYDRRHGYRGPEAYVDVPSGSADEALSDALSEVIDMDGLEGAVVLEASPTKVKAYTRAGESVEISGDGLKFAQRHLTDKVLPNQRVRRGAIIRLARDEKNRLLIGQIPDIEAALIAVDPNNGAVKALVGGLDFNRNRFNHVTQAWRQPGSSFKPFIYSASLEKGFTPSSVINDAPLSFGAAETGSQAWEPKNFDGKFDGPMSMRKALTKSKNLVSVRILQAIGAPFAQEYATRFGFDAEKHPPYLTMALGAGSVTPLQMAGGYSVFANGGYRTFPYYIERIQDGAGKVLAQSQPVKAGENAERAIDARNAFIMTSMMGDVVKFGTAARAMSLGRQDLAGKTGTTNDHIDAWFSGFQRNLVAIAWIGFDQPKPMGGQETGGQAALPMWIYYMSKVLKDIPQDTPTPPEGVVTIGGEYYYEENANKARSLLEGEDPAKDKVEDLQQLF